MNVARYGYFGLLSLMALYSASSLSQMVVLGQDDSAEPITEYRAFIQQRLESFSMDLSMRDLLMDVPGSRIGSASALKLVEDENLSRQSTTQPTPFSVCVLGTDSYSQWWLENLVLASDMPEADVCLVLGVGQANDVEKMGNKYHQVLFVPISDHHFGNLYPDIEHYPIVLVESGRRPNGTQLVAGVAGVAGIPGN